MDTRGTRAERDELRDETEQPEAKLEAQGGGAEQEPSEQRTSAEGGEAAQAPEEPSAPESRGTESLEAAAEPLTAGQIVEGLIMQIDQDGALVDVGTKSEGHVSPEELAGATTDEGKPLEVGDRIAVYVLRPESDEGHPVLSKKRADYERVWRRVVEGYEKDEVLSAMVTDRVKGGLVVDLGLRGFLPASHVRTRNVHALDRFVGQSLKVKIIEVDRARKRVVVSHKKAVEEDRRKRRDKTLASLEENKVYRGIVRRITNYGAFVDLGGVDGLLHITEMSWTRIEHPSDVVKVGDKIDVMVLRFDRERNRISLGLKQILPDPWEDAAKTYSVGQIVSAKVSRIVPFGAFVKLESGIEGIVPNSELPGERGQRAADMLSTGQEIQVKIVNIRPNERRMTLSLRQFEQAKERQQLQEYMQRQEEESRVTIGDLFGPMLEETKAAREENEGGEGEPQEEKGRGEAGKAAEGRGAEQAEAEQSAEPEKASEAGAGGSTESAAEEETETESSEGREWSSSESPAESEAEKD